MNNKSNVIGAGDGSTSNKSISVGIYIYVSFSGNQIHNVTGSICVGVAGFIKGGGLDDLVFLSFCGAFRNGYANDRRLRSVVISAFNNLTLNCFPAYSEILLSSGIFAALANNVDVIKTQREKAEQAKRRIFIFLSS